MPDNDDQTEVTLTRANELLVQHYSKEVELASQQLTEQRTKNNLWVAVGPFFVLGGLATSETGVEALQKTQPSVLVLTALGVMLSYAILGAIAASVEMGIWRRANTCRTAVAELLGEEPARLEYSQQGLIATYTTIFVILGGTFVGLASIIYHFG